MFISMNYENSCGYLCFCCADAVDCGVGWVSWVGGLDGVLFWMTVWVCEWRLLESGL